ncbi:MAG: PH domain-containing protein [Candidatus Micrarchaeota archaeon]|nr:PH domain-containing protein [Candidatus Micrarchaeota archaeon]
MEYMRLRPAMRPFVRLVGAYLVLLIILSVAAWFYAPGVQFALQFLSPFLALAGLAWLLSRYYTHLSNEYVVLDSEIVELTGIWIKREYHVPIDHIQDYTVLRTWMSVVLGLANIGIQTGRGEGGYEVILRAIHEKDRAALTQLLEKLVRPAGNPRPGASAPPPAPAELDSITPERR